MNYCRSIAPHSLELGEKEPMTGVDEGNVTYPEFYLLSGGDLLFAYRSGSSGRGNLVMNRYSLKEKKWSRVQDVLIDGENKRNAYWQLYVDELGTIHLSWVWRETWHVETNHDLCYARSFDNGVTWYKANDKKYDLPIRLGNAEYACRIPQNSELINQTSMSADAGGNPYIASYWRDPDSESRNTGLSGMTADVAQPPGLRAYHSVFPERWRHEDDSDGPSAHRSRWRGDILCIQG